ncbi:MAG: flagellar filament capping protein FliD [Nitrospinota bacterium]|nr:flagellar filament capping protein FliD [Nitrospinota bacterium]
MTTFGISGNLIPPLFPKSDRLDGVTLNDFRAQVSQFGTDRPSPADLLFDSFVFVSNRVPQVDDLRGPLSAFRVNAAGRFVTERFQNSHLPIVDEVGASRLTTRQTDDIGNLQIRLQALLDKVEELRLGNAFNLLTAKSSDTNALKVTADSTAEEARFEVTIDAKATRSVLASDAQGAGALGLTGSFRINGVEIDVIATDTLADIQLKINRGEDINGNGALDEAEDVNGNGIIETIQISGSQYGSGIFIIEDQNGNGVLDPAEDVNGNQRLDGGTQDHQVTATIQENRLLLTSQTGNDSAITLSDPDGVLFALGFFELDANGTVVQKEVQISASGNNLVANGTDAEITIDGETFTSSTNTFTDILSGLTLEVRGEPGKTVRVTVETDAGPAVEQIQSLLMRFNDALTALNDSLAFAKTFAADFELQSVREELTENAQTGIRSNERLDASREAVDPSNNLPPSLGLNSANTEKFSTTELGITRTAQAIRDGLGALFSNRGSELFKNLSSVGIKTESDDTIRVNVPALTLALESQTNDVLELFNDTETGILPRLQTQLESLLNGDVGRLDLKSARLEALSELDTGTEESFQRAFEKLLLETTTRKLIAIA